MPDEPSTPPTLPPPSAFNATSEAELRIALAARATTAMHPLPPLKARPRVVMDGDAIGWTELSAFAGFAPTYFLRGLSDKAPLSPLLHVHGAAFSAWLLLLVTQSTLVAAHRVAWHKRLGIFGAVLAAAM